MKGTMSAVMFLGSRLSSACAPDLQASSAGGGWRVADSDPKRRLLLALRSAPTRSHSAAMATPQVFRSKEDMRAWSRARRREGKTIGFVPTMAS